MKDSRNKCIYCNRNIYGGNGPDHYWFISRWDVSKYRESNKSEDIKFATIVFCDDCFNKSGLRAGINKIIVIGEI